MRAALAFSLVLLAGCASHRGSTLDAPACSPLPRRLARSSWDSHPPSAIRAGRYAVTFVADSGRARGRRVSTTFWLARVPDDSSGRTLHGAFATSPWAAFELGSSWRLTSSDVEQPGLLTGRTPGGGVRLYMGYRPLQLDGWQSNMDVLEASDAGLLLGRWEASFFSRVARGHFCARYLGS